MLGSDVTLTGPRVSGVAAMHSCPLHPESCTLSTSTGCQTNTDPKDDHDEIVVLLAISHGQ